MPYIAALAREELDMMTRNTVTPGELNYWITTDILRYLERKGELSYTNINEVIGVLECAKLELYRRLAVPYEDKKKEENGDVYSDV